MIGKLSGPFEVAWRFDNIGRSASETPNRRKRLSVVAVRSRSALSFARVLQEYPYLALVVYIGLASVGVPMPEDIGLLLAGLACYLERARIEFMIPLAMASVLCGDIFIYSLGRRWGTHLLEHRFARRLATEEQIEGIRRQFRRHEMKTIFIARFLPGLRALVFLTAGAVRINFWRFLLANGTAALLSVPGLILLGYLFGHSFDRLKEHVTDVKHAVVIVVIVAAGIYITWHTFARSAKDKEAKRLLANDAPDDREPQSEVIREKKAVETAKPQ